MSELKGIQLNSIQNKIFHSSPLHVSDSSGFTIQRAKRHSWNKDKWELKAKTLFN